VWDERSCEGSYLRASQGFKLFQEVVLSQSHITFQLLVVPPRHLQLLFGQIHFVNGKRKEKAGQRKSNGDNTPEERALQCSALVHRLTHSCNSGELSAGAEQAALQQVALLDDTLHVSRVIGAHLDLLAGWKQSRLQGVLRTQQAAQFRPMDGVSLSSRAHGPCF